MKRMIVRGITKTGLICIALSLGTVMEAQVVRGRNVIAQQNITEEDYYYALGEATKQFMLQNYQQAVALYVECLRYKPESAAVNYQLSQIFIRAGDLERSLSFARDAYENEKTNKWYLINLMNLYQNKGDTDSALYCMKTLSNMEPFNMEYKYMLASLYEQAGSYEEALDNLNEVEQQLGISKEVLVAKYGLYMQDGNKKNALQELQKAKTYFQEDYAIVGMMAEFFMEQNQYDSARFYYREIIQENLDNMDVAISYSDFLIETGMPDSARNVMLRTITSEGISERQKETYFYQMIQDESFFSKSAVMADTLSKAFYQMYPEEVGVQSVFADIQMRLGNYEDASAMLKKIFLEDRNNYIAIEQLIYLENMMNRVDSVIHYARIATQAFANRPVSYLYLGGALLQKKQYSEAVQYLERGRRYVMGGSFKIQYYSLLAENYYGIQKYDSTWSCFETALALDPENVIVNNNYAYYLAEQGLQLEKAEKLSSFTLEEDPKNPTYLDTYAWVLFKMGNVKGAMKYMKKALKYEGDNNAEILEHYGDILFTMGKYKESVENWRKAIQYDASIRESIMLKIMDAEQKMK